MGRARSAYEIFKKRYLSKEEPGQPGASRSCPVVAARVRAAWNDADECEKQLCIAMALASKGLAKHAKAARQLRHSEGAAHALRDAAGEDQPQSVLAPVALECASWDAAARRHAAFAGERSQDVVRLAANGDGTEFQREVLPTDPFSSDAVRDFRKGHGLFAGEPKRTVRSISAAWKDAWERGCDADEDFPADNEITYPGACGGVCSHTTPASRLVYVAQIKRLLTQLVDEHSEVVVNGKKKTRARVISNRDLFLSLTARGSEHMAPCVVRCCDALQAHGRRPARQTFLALEVELAKPPPSRHLLEGACLWPSCSSFAEPADAWSSVLREATHGVLGHVDYDALSSQFAHVEGVRVEVLSCEPAILEIDYRCAWRVQGVSARHDVVHDPSATSDSSVSVSGGGSSSTITATAPTAAAPLATDASKDEDSSDDGFGVGAPCFLNVLTAGAPAGGPLEPEQSEHSGLVVHDSEMKELLAGEELLKATVAVDDLLDRLDTVVLAHADDAAAADVDDAAPAPAPAPPPPVRSFAQMCEELGFVDVSTDRVWKAAESSQPNRPILAIHTVGGKKNTVKADCLRHRGRCSLWAPSNVYAASKMGVLQDFLSWAGEGRSMSEAEHLDAALVLKNSWGVHSAPAP